MHSDEAGNESLTAFLSQDCEAEDCNWLPVRAACETSQQSRNSTSVANQPKVAARRLDSEQALNLRVVQRSELACDRLLESFAMRQGCPTDWLILSDTHLVAAPCHR